MPETWDAAGYERDLARGLSLSGETADWFAEERVRRVAERLEGAGGSLRTIVEFGCGTGNNLGPLARCFPRARIVGIDANQSMLEAARARHPEPQIELRAAPGDAAGATDLVFVNGVFHHMPHHTHGAQLEAFRSWLRPGGRLALFDNNPLNPGARLVMRRIPFDRDARMLSPYTLKRLARGSGFVDVTCRFYFVFPAPLRALRGLEPHLERLPLAAQYAVFAVAPPG